MRQKVIVIGSLLHDPKNWIIDEPMTGLDPNATFKLKNIMRRRTVFLFRTQMTGSKLRKKLPQTEMPNFPA